MKELGFKNFGRFANFPALKTGNINFLVGKNNSGKSTYINALTLCANNLPVIGQKNHPGFVGRLYPFFNFALNQTHKRKVCDFNRAYFHKAESDFRFPLCLCTRYIDFSFVEGILKYTIVIGAEELDGNMIEVPIVLISVMDQSNGLEFVFNYISNQVTIKFPEHINNNNENPCFDLFCGDELTFDMEPFENYEYNWSHELCFVLDGIIWQIERDYVKKSDDINSLSMSFLISEIKKMKDKLKVFTHPSVEFVSHINAGHKSVFNINDKDDEMAQVIHEYSLHSTSHDFIRKIMHDFEIGDDYKIDCVEGEAYIVKILVGEDPISDKSWRNLMDYGVGCVNLFMILLQLANIIYKYVIEVEQDDASDVLVVLEEPEQNLHPQLQSKLADLLLYVNKNYGFCFLVETHSEYLIRKSQVLVSNLGCQSEEELTSKNPFRTFYFPIEDIPYEMEYTTSGLFRQKFGKGFFDEAGDMHLELLKQIQENQV